LSAPSLNDISKLWFKQPVDHFDTSNNDTYEQRYYVYGKYYKNNGPIFFYCGNEADVTLYVNNTGLIWENAEKFNALVIFAEHRYYGESQPLKNNANRLQYLTHQQALGDYASLLQSIKKEYKMQEKTPIIAFGGSYGGMLAAWFRMKYPWLITGSIAASAPILAFEPLGYKNEAYWQVVTKDMTKFCQNEIHSAFNVIDQLLSTPNGQQQLLDTFKLCTLPNTPTLVKNFKEWIMMAYDTMAMGSFPYTSSYMTNGAANLPAWPMKTACNILSADATNDNLLGRIYNSISIYTNASRNLQCNELNGDFDGIWDYQWCTEMLPQESYFNTNGKTDMFYSRNITYEDIKKKCLNTWKVAPSKSLIAELYGGIQGVQQTSNIVFSNGLLDPWSSGGVLENYGNNKIHVITIPEGGHHVDLFFSHPEDTVSMKNARKKEMDIIQSWINENEQLAQE